jgi:hypothetical protein
MKGQVTMKKLKGMKGILSIAMAVAMISCLFVVSASAVTTTADKPFTELEVTKKVVSTSGASLPSETFKITMTPADDLRDEDGNLKNKDTSGIVIEEGLALAEDTLEFSVDSTTDNTDGLVVLTDKFELDELETGLAYDHTGIYRYYVKEVLPTDEDGKEITTNGYITFDDTVYTVDLYVEQDSSNDFVITGIVLYSSKITDGSKPTSVVFKNEIAVSNVLIYKTVEGTEYNKGQLYQFAILIPEGGETIDLKAGENSYLSAYIYKGSTKVIDTGSGNDEKIARTDSNGLVKLFVGGKTLSDDVFTNGTTFYLKDGEHLVIEGAPVSMCYVVQEKDYSSQNYTTAATYEEWGSFSTSTQPNNDDHISSVKSATVRGTVNTRTNEIRYTNTRNITVPGGVYVEYLPYAIILVAAVALGAVYMIRRKKKSSI